MQPVLLSCEYLSNPLGIDIPAPCFSWQFKSGLRNQFQSGYELLVGDDLNVIRSDSGNVWSTGKISSSQSVQIEYRGKPLRSFTRYYWRVKVFNQNNEASSWSDINWFETAMMDPADWKAQWINDGSKLPEWEDYFKQDRMPLFRKAFPVPRQILSARLYISGLGYYEAYLNGNKIGDHGQQQIITWF